MYEQHFVDRTLHAIPIQENQVLTRLECAVVCEANPICNAFALNTTKTINISTVDCMAAASTNMRVTSLMHQEFNTGTNNKCLTMY